MKQHIIFLCTESFEFISKQKFYFKKEKGKLAELKEIRLTATVKGSG